jgi:hypothetical protein
MMAINSVNGNTLLESGIFAPCRAATTAAIALSGLQTVDTVALNAGDRVLVAGQADATTNGIYAASTGGWVRTTDAASNASFFDGMAVLIAAGAANAGQLFQCTCADDPVIIGTSNLTFASQSAVQTALQTATSTSSVAIAAGAASFAIAAGKSFAVNRYVLVYETSNPANAMLAQVSSYIGTALGVTVVATGGSGTHSDWTIVLANSPASAGLVPPIGTGNVTGPGSSGSGNLPVFSGSTGKVLADSGIAPGTLAGRNTLLYGDAGAASIGDVGLVAGAGARPYFTGQPNDNLHIVNDATNPTRDIDITPGRCPDDADLIYLQLAGTMVKRLDTAWAAGGVAGSPAGGCDTGTKGASQTWHVYAIAKRGLTVTSISRTGNVATATCAGHGLGVGGTARNYGIGNGFDGLAVITGVTTNTYSYANTGSNVSATAVGGTVDAFDVLASQSYNGPTMPSGWNAKQCLGSVLTDGSGNIRGVLQIGDKFDFAVPINDFNGVPTTSRVAQPLSAPLGVAVNAIVDATLNNVSSTLYVNLCALAETDVAVTTNGNFCAVSSGIASGQFEILTNTSAQISVRAGTASAATLNLWTKGYRDPRRRLF